jgi:hypothetical protein
MLRRWQVARLLLATLILAASWVLTALSAVPQAWSWVLPVVPVTVVFALLAVSELSRYVDQLQAPTPHVRALHAYAELLEAQVKSNYIAAPPDSDAIAASFRVHYPVLTRTADTWNEQRKGREQARSDITSAVTQEIASLQSPWVGINVEGTDPLLAGIARGDIPTEGLRLEWSSDNTLTAYAPSFAPMPIAHVRAGEGQAESDAQAGQAQLPGAVQASIQRALTWPASIAYREHDGILMAMKDGLRIQLQEAGETHEVHRERACLLCQPHSARTRR